MTWLDNRLSKSIIVNLLVVWIPLVRCKLMLHFVTCWHKTKNDRAKINVSDTFSVT